MGLHNNGEAEEPALRSAPRPSAGPICSLNEACLHTLHTCVVDSPLREIALPLMRICFFCGATHAVFLLDKGHGAQLAADIAGFLREKPRS